MTSFGDIRRHLSEPFSGPRHRGLCGFRSTTSTATEQTSVEDDKMAVHIAVVGSVGGVAQVPDKLRIYIYIYIHMCVYMDICLFLFTICIFECVYII